MRKKRFWRKVVAGAAACATVLSALSIVPAEPVEAAAQTPRMVVDMTDRQGEIMHGASGFLYGGCAYHRSDYAAEADGSGHKRNPGNGASLWRRGGCG